ncbi:hypothetical protein HYV12_01560 [Candidatus Dojkabacteria bacterium]|nr:hypothetical protein [Candidatus Dojkabacteria bacterium]
MPIFVKRYISQEVDTQSITSVYKYTPENYGGNSVGEMYALITVSKTPEGYASRASKFVWDAILETYSGSSGSIIDSVKESISAGSKKLLEMLKNDKEVEEGGIDISFAIVVIKEATAFLGVFGEQEIFVHKEGDIVNVSEVLKKNKVMALSFALGQEDILIISSPMLFSETLLRMKGDELSSVLLEINDTLKKGQGVLLLSRSEIGEDFEDIEEIEEAPLDPEPGYDSEVTSQATELIHKEYEIIQPPEEVPSVPENKEIESEVRKSTFKEKWATFVIWFNSTTGKIKSAWLEIWNKLSNFMMPLSSRLEKILHKFGGSFWGFVDDKYGRQVWYKRIKSKLSAMRLSKGSSAYGMKIDGYRESSVRGKRFGTLILGVLLVIALLGGIQLSIKAKEARELHRVAAEVFDVVENYIKQAESYLPGDTEQASGYLTQATAELQKVEGKKLSFDDQKKLSDLKESLGKIDDRVAKRVWVSEENGNLEIFLSTRIEFDKKGESKSQPTDMTVYKDDYQNESLFVVDNGLKAVYRINIFDKSAVKIPDKRGLVKSPKYIDIGTHGVYVFDEISGVIRSQFDSKLGNLDFESLTGLGADDLGINDVSEFAVFTPNDHVYLLSPTNKAIYRSNFTGNGYTLPFAHISSETFDSARDFFGDIAIYVVTGVDNEVERYSAGDNPQKLPLSAEGLNAVGGASAGHTGGTLDNLMYIFEGGDSPRIISFEKPKEAIGDSRHPNELLRVNEYRYQGDRDDVFKDVQDLVTDYQERYMYILDGTVIRRVVIQK